MYSTGIFRTDNPYYGAFTLFFIIAPFITSVIFTMSAMSLARSWKWKRLFECFFHLPGLQLIKHIQFLNELNRSMTNMNQAHELAKSVLSWVDVCAVQLGEKKEWTWSMIETQIEDDCLSLEDSKKLKLMFEEKLKEDNSASLYCNASNVLRRLVIENKKTKVKYLGQVEARIQEFKMMEAFLESFPQFILQTCATIHFFAIVDPTFQAMFGKKQLMLTLFSSLFSVVNTVISAFVKMPHVYEEEKRPISRYWKNYLVVGPLILILVTPRLIVISCFFACIRYGVCVAIMTIALSGYAIPYWLYIYAKFKGCGKETVKMILVNFATSILGPCIVVDPTKALIFHSCLFSMIGYLMLLGGLLVSSILWPHLYILSPDQMLPFIKLFLIMMPVIVITSLCSYLQLEEKKQLFALKTGIGSICCPEKDELVWAIERRYDNLIKHTLDSGYEKLSKISHYELIDAKKLGPLFWEACERQWFEVLGKILLHQDYDEIINYGDSQRETGFMKACFKGNITVVEMLLNDPCGHDIMGTVDIKEETGLMKACSSGKIAMVEFLLKHPGSQEIFNCKNKIGETAFIKTCQHLKWVGQLGTDVKLDMGQIKVMRFLLNHETFLIQENDVYSGFSTICESYRQINRKLDRAINEDEIANLEEILQTCQDNIGLFLKHDERKNTIFNKLGIGEFVEYNNVKRQQEYPNSILFQIKDGN